MRELVGEALRVLRNRPAGLISDFDGTLSEIAPTPEAARLHPACRRALRAIGRHLELVALVSGRKAADLRDRVGLPGICYVGLHGADWGEGPPAEPAVSRLAGWLQDRLGPGLRLELKGPGFSVHYRGSPDPAEARRQILGLLADRVPPGYLVTEGKQVVEVRPAGADKGLAVGRLIERFNLRSLIYLGDDLTDLEAFRAVDRWRVGGGLGLTIAVAGPETPPEVTAAADKTLPSVEEVCRFLSRLALELRRSA